MRAFGFGARIDLRRSSISRSEALRQAMMALLDGPGSVDRSGHSIFSYAHPLFWAPYSLIGDGG
jgi:CHAT domain-containing protein